MFWQNVISHNSSYYLKNVCCRNKFLVNYFVIRSYIILNFSGMWVYGCVFKAWKQVLEIFFEQHPLLVFDLFQERYALLVLRRGGQNRTWLWCAAPNYLPRSPPIIIVNHFEPEVYSLRLYYRQIFMKINSFRKIIEIIFILEKYIVQE